MSFIHIRTHKEADKRPFDGGQIEIFKSNGLSLVADLRGGESVNPFYIKVFTDFSKSVPFRINLQKKHRIRRIFVSSFKVLARARMADR